jgi:hypothetical protein
VNYIRYESGSHTKLDLGWKKLDMNYGLSDRTFAFRMAIFLHLHVKMAWFERQPPVGMQRWDLQSASLWGGNEYAKELVLLIDGFVFGEKVRYGELKDAVIDVLIRCVAVPTSTDCVGGPSLWR